MGAKWLLLQFLANGASLPSIAVRGPDGSHVACIINKRISELWHTQEVPALIRLARASCQITDKLRL